MTAADSPKDNNLIIPHLYTKRPKNTSYLHDILLGEDNPAVYHRIKLLYFRHFSAVINIVIINPLVFSQCTVVIQIIPGAG